MSALTSWRLERGDVRAMLLVALIPVLLAIPQLTPWLKASPAYYVAKIAVDGGGAIQRGQPYADPNNGFQTEALGYRAAVDWLRGEVPWWNHYSGIGMPLAAEYQPAAFFPLTLLLLLPRGTVLLQLALQLVAGLGTFALLRHGGLSRLAATAGGAIFALNGTLAWLSHGPASAVPWLPWLLLGIERAFAAASHSSSRGWRLIGIAIGLSLLAGFPETAYINGLLGLAWTVVRAAQSSREIRLAFLVRVVAGGCTGLFMAAPQVVSFFLYLPNSHVAGHAEIFANAALPPPAVLVTLVAPYYFGPIFGYAQQWPTLLLVWGSVGGFVSIALVALAVYGFAARRDAIAWLLLVWTIATIAKSFGIQPFAMLWNLVPGVATAAFARYAHPSWELALVVLAARAIDSILREGVQWKAFQVMAVAIAIGLAAAIGYAAYLWQLMPAVQGMRNWMTASALWAVGSVILVAVQLLRSEATKAARILATFLVVEAALLCGIPILSTPRSGHISDGISFLRENLGMQRFYTTGPIQPNYGAYFGIAAINHNYLPVPENWVRHVQSRLDRRWTDVVVFNGADDRNSLDELRANIHAFEELGVKYVVAPRGQDPLVGIPGIRQVYADSLMRIFELPAPKSYFEDVGGKCRLEASDRNHVRATCESASVVVRRELYFDGWTVSVNSQSAAITRYDEIFQGINLSEGTNDVRFRYMPPHIGWAWLACFIGLAVLVTPPSSLLFRRKHQ